MAKAKDKTTVSTAPADEDMEGIAVMTIRVRLDDGSLGYRVITHVPGRPPETREHAQLPAAVVASSRAQLRTVMQNGDVMIDKAGS